MLFHLLKKYKWQAIGSVGMILIYVLSSLLQPRFLQNVLAAVTANQQSEIMRLGVWLLVIAVIGLAAGALNTVLASYVSQSVAADLREKVFRKIQTFSYANIEEFNAGNLVVRMTNDINQVQNLLMMAFQVLLRMPILFIGATVLALTTLPQLWWIVVLMIVLIAIAMMVIMGIMGPRFAIFQKLMDQINAIAKENLRGVRVVKSFVQEKNQADKFQKVSDELLEQNLFIGTGFAFLEPVFMLVSYLAIYATIYVVYTMTGSQPDAVTKLASFNTYLMQIMFAIIMVGFMGSNITRAMVSINRIKEVLDTDPAMTFEENGVTDVAGTISFENVTFTYPHDEYPTLKNISFEIEAGQMIGVVGATGAGKSTLAQLIPRLFDPQAGQIKIGGVDIKTISQSTLRDTVSIVLQKAILFTGTVASNIRQGKLDAHDTEIERAARIAQAREFITRMPDQYDSQVEERGNNFSGGQKQRMSIARGLVSNPKILILDDSTSALDAKSEKLVQEALVHDLKDTTTIIIAQKISSVVKADKILVLDEGRLIGQGTHAELVVGNAVYREIFETQKGKEED
ncbi:ATP-binding cassette subfamily B multidrug efflux pump [Streptococcus gallinaceus]|uniref:ABC transporter ATP-binding protein n=1 Tax=Streptococcus gallinaceus TaxID=165758 RepID=UPI0020A13E30|nr:ABC transporter ATP-binding protein [Streptococcus gallinaceus]MCP1639569.1 ATP-binding cassette subfamily B multidrug efflux pump [Streptococcus gallinaceus]MCP1770352.1 ATP-binding cassette subfamily B multidrug efflux pump [Streptococcus gallinaceus]